ncbi:unnamed protein product [Gordionus sp. m RMFG-2023]|uniref:zinc finger SWIM domain-containing protein 3-like n=1 Tax=Gordionus sp. m RMFG-2023 TaxID=3053472 RepID=UPI0030E4E8DF
MALYLGATFNSHEELENAIKEYSEANSVNFAKSESRLLKSNLFAEEICHTYKYKKVTFSCKFANINKYSYSVRKTMTNRIDCPASFGVSFSKANNNLVIVRFCDSHNHEMVNAPGPNDTSLFFDDPLADEDTSLNYLSPNTSLPHHSNNLTIAESSAAASHLENTASSSPDHLLSTLEKIKNTPGLTLEIYLEANNLLSVFFQTDEMKFYFSAYPDLLLIDNVSYYEDACVATYTLSVVDGFGFCQIAAVWCVIAETFEIMGQMAELFKRYNEAWTRVRVVVVDKDPPDTRVFAEAFPLAQIEISASRVSRAFKRDVNPRNCASLSGGADRVRRILDSLTRLSDASSVEEFQSIAEVELTDARAECPPLAAYLDEYWWPKKSLWAKAYRPLAISAILDRGIQHRRGGYLVHKLRPALRNYTGFASFLRDLVAFSRALGDKRDYDATTACIKRCVNTHPVGSALYGFRELLTTYAFGLVTEELRESESIEAFNAANDPTSTTECLCELYNSFHLPCRHIFAARKALGMDQYHPLLCDSRWQIDYFKKQRKLYLMKMANTPVTNGTPQPSIQDIIDTCKNDSQELINIISVLPREKLEGYSVHIKLLVDLAKKGEVPIAVTET